MIALCCSPADFNPRSLTGATGRGNGFSKSFTISIHAPSRERHNLPLCCCLPLQFQSTLPHGSDGNMFSNCYELTTLFQSTLPHGSDQKYPAEAYDTADFNPRSLTGATLKDAKAYISINNFNPRSLTGATSCRNGYKLNIMISIHAPSRERLFSITNTTKNLTISIHAPSRERPILVW